MLRKIKYIFLLPLFAMVSCDKSELDLENPNKPGLSSLKTEEGIKRYALGIHGKLDYTYYWWALTNHEIMGDSYTCSAGNWSWRWTNQVSEIILPSGQILTPPQGYSQKEMLKRVNDRSQGDNNVFNHEWKPVYALNNHANNLLSILNTGEVQFIEQAALKTKILKAWAYWWKGFSYSRIGSLYVAGIVTDIPNETNGDFVTHTDVINEATRNFDLAIALLQDIQTNHSSEMAVYDDFFKSLIPSFTNTGNGGVISPEEWVRNINTYKARNILVNTYADDLTSAQLAEIQTLTTNGLRQGDKIFTMRSAAADDVVLTTAWNPYRALVGWTRVSERLVQDFNTGDARFTRNLRLKPSPVVNPSGRGFQYGTRYDLIDISSGGDWVSTTTGAVEIPIATSFEENELMRAEAEIRSGNINAGLIHIDNVRSHQNAGLPALNGTGLSATQALEELRRERRIGLVNKGVSFYDARRWKVLLPVSQGGGRTGAVVVLSGTVETNATINYNYLERFDVPVNELEFNKPSSLSAPVSQN